MEKYKHLITKTLPAIVAVFMYGCAGVDMGKLAKQQKLTSNPSPLELHGDSVKFELSAVVPVKMLKKNKIYTVSTGYRAYENNLDLGKVIFNGNEFPNAATTPPTLSKKFAFAYDDKYKKGVLYVVGEMASLNKTGKKTPEITVTSGIITTPLLVKDVYPSVLADHGYDNREELTPTYINFFFKKGISKLDVKEKTGARAKYFEKFIAKKYITRTVNIVGTHSPEGAETVNERLSEERAIAIEKYYREMMKKFNYGTKSDSISFVTKGKVKDWTDFKAKLDSAKKLSADQKTEILSVIDNTDGSFRQKEAELQKLKSYKYLLSEIYPKLRNAQTEVLTAVTKKTDAQIYLIAKKIAKDSVTKDTLNAKELLYAATLTPSPEEQEAILLASTKKYDSYEAHNNLGALYLEKAKKELNASAKSDLIDKAAVQFDIAKNKNEGAEVFLNIASVKLLKGDKAGAAEALTTASSKGGSAEVTKGIKGLQGVLDIKSGNYESAVSNLSNAGTDAAVTFDRGLALLLKKDFQAAKSTLVDAIAADPNQPVFYYVAAIASARLNEIDGVSSNLKSAFKLDDSLKRKAIDDLEFTNFKTNEQFKDALK